MLDSLLQEVCIESGLPSLVTPLFRTKESPLTMIINVLISDVFFLVVRCIKDCRGSAYYDNNVRMVFLHSLFLRVGVYVTII